MFFKSLILSTACAALPFAAGAATITMTFDEVTGNGTEFDDTIGDSINVDVSNRSVATFGDGATSDVALRHWTDNYSGLTDVAYMAADGTVGELQFDVAAGTQITFDSFDFGNYFNGNAARNALFQIFDEDWNVVWDLDVIGHTGAEVTVSPDVTLTGTSYFQWGTDCDIGIDNFAYTTADVSAMAPVPLPAGLPLLLAAFGALGLLKRRHRG